MSVLRYRKEKHMDEYLVDVVNEIAEKFSWDEPQRLEVLKLLNTAYNKGIEDSVERNEVAYYRSFL